PSSYPHHYLSCTSFNQQLLIKLPFLIVLPLLSSFAIHHHPAIKVLAALLAIPVLLLLFLSCSNT
ncbi:hypothetical protein PTTG_30970, partial [Puccinia triticina 1-1 BBBD Race 1]